MSELRDSIFPNDKMLAEILHCTMCPISENADQCTWCNEEDWNGEEHKLYLEKARKALSISDFNTIVRLTNILN